jgi:hypothetical protein
MKKDAEIKNEGIRAHIQIQKDTCWVKKYTFIKVL